jgi:hypothetical protein
MRQHRGVVQLRQLRLVEKEVLVTVPSETSVNCQKKPLNPNSRWRKSEKPDRRALNISSIYGSSRYLPSETVVKLELSTKTQRFWMNRTWRWLNMWSQSLFGCTHTHIYIYDVYIYLYIYNVYISVYDVYIYMHMITQCIWTWLKKGTPALQRWYQKAGEMLGK